MGLSEGADNPDEVPAHTVELDAFYIDQFEVTNAQYGQFVAETGHPPPLFWDDPQLNQPNQPVVGVTWEDATTYATWAGKRLPTEAEWEIAVRGLRQGDFPWGDEFDPQIDGETLHANIEGVLDGFELTAPVGSFPTGTSEFGLHDMAGNVMEWIADWYSADYYQDSPSENPEGPVFGGLGRVLRGGSWNDTPAEVRTTKRRALLPTLADKTIGFRCVRDFTDDSTQTETPWDVNSDGTVNIFDLVLVGSNFGQENPTIGDVNGDGRVNVFDLVLVGSHFGERTNVASPPLALRPILLDSEARQRLKMAVEALQSIQNPSTDAYHVRVLLTEWIARYQTREIRETQLFANYPNPFNPETWIPFQLSRPAETTIYIHDTTGRRIRQLDLGYLQPGVYTTRNRPAYWDGRDMNGEEVSSGLYFYTLDAGGFQTTRRMLLVK